MVNLQEQNQIFPEIKVVNLRENSQILPEIKVVNLQEKMQIFPEIVKYAEFQILSVLMEVFKSFVIHYWYALLKCALISLHWKCV